jgi:deoxyadenosine/deoxycytidine kinase
MRSSEHSIWAVPGSLDNASPLYVCVIGNSGAGKSTLVNRVAETLFSPNEVVAIDERDTHHPFLDRLFFDPGRYALQLQLNFMVQRILIARRWLDAGFHVVMERSHLDDTIFVSHLESIGVITRSEREAYEQVWTALVSHTPKPNLVIALSAPADVCIARITRAEQLGERPREFPDEQTKQRWVTSWAGFYQARFDRLADQPDLYESFIRFDHKTHTDKMIPTITKLLRERAES